MRTTPVSKKELAICARLRTARESLGVTQDECASQLGIERSTYANYERGRAPVRVSLAMRFCRQFIISEEWLATGLHEACHAAAKARGKGWDKVVDEQIFRRQCMDLFSEPAAQRITPQTLFSEAYAQTLAPIYARHAQEFFYNPRIELHEGDNSMIGINLLTAINERNILLLSQNAMLLKKSESEVARAYVRCVFEASDLIARKFLGGDTPAKLLNPEHWLRFSLEHPSLPIGPLLVEPEVLRITSIPVGKAGLAKS